MEVKVWIEGLTVEGEVEVSGSKDLGLGSPVEVGGSAIEVKGLGLS